MAALHRPDRDKHRSQLNRDLGWILLAFAIFNTYMLIISTQVNMAVFGVFLTLELTEIFLFLGNFTTKVAALPPDPTQLDADRDRRLDRRHHGARRLVRLGGGGDERPQGQAGLPGRQAALQPVAVSGASRSALVP